MARNLDPKCKQCRRAGEKLFLKGERCFTPKCPVVKRNYAPGQHGQSRQGRPSEYSIQLKEKQKVRKMYGMMERDFRILYDRARKMTGDVSSNMVTLLETRLDNVVFRLGFAQSRNQARQFVRHGHVILNGKRSSIPSSRVSTGDKISISDSAVEKSATLQQIQKQLKNHNAPSWLSRTGEQFEGEVVSAPAVDDLKAAYNLQLIVEYYSR